MFDKMFKALEGDNGKNEMSNRDEYFGGSQRSENLDLKNFQREYQE